MDFTVGTPAQTLSLQVDTGSSDIWVNARTSNLCLEGHCILGGSYDPNSRTKKIVSNEFWIEYGDKATASGQFITDSIYFDHKMVPDVQFGLAFSSTSDPGMFGLGYPSNEAQLPLGQGRYYTSFTRILVRHGIINIKAFSMWMIDDDKGVLLFGGADKNQYSGELKTVPIIPADDGAFINIQIQLHKISFSQGKDILELPSGIPSATTALLDCGSNVVDVPHSIAAKIYSILEAETLENNDIYFIRCKLADSSMTINFNMAAITIQIALKSFIFPWDGKLRPKTADRLCRLPIQISPTNAFILGTPFLRNVYVVYDLDHNEISLAPVKRGVLDSDIVEIGADGDVSRASDGSFTPEVADADNQVPLTAASAATDIDDGADIMAAGLKPPGDGSGDLRGSLNVDDFNV